MTNNKCSATHENSWCYIICSFKRPLVGNILLHLLQPTIFTWISQRRGFRKSRCGMYKNYYKYQQTRLSWGLVIFHGNISCVTLNGQNVEVDNHFFHKPTHCLYEFLIYGFVIYQGFTWYPTFLTTEWFSIVCLFTCICRLFCCPEHFVQLSQPSLFSWPWYKIKCLSV